MKELQQVGRAELAELRHAMLRFYYSDGSYYERAASSDKARFYAEVVSATGLSHKKGAAVLELGVGTPSFPAYCPARGIVIDYECQDVVPWTRNACRPVDLVPKEAFHHGDFLELRFGRRYELVFSTFMWEHVVRPKRFAEKIQDLVSPGGYAVFINPKYDFPLYVNPAMRHFPFHKILAFKLKTSVAVLVGPGRPQFNMIGTPRCLVESYERDYDGVHNVLERDLDLTFSGWRKIRLRPKLTSLRGRIFERLILLAVAYRRPESISRCG